MKRFSLSVLAMLVAGYALSQDIGLPDKIDVKTNRMATITIKSAAKDTLYTVNPADNLDVFREYDPDSSVIRLRFLPYSDGTYFLTVGGATGDKETLKTCVITATGGVPPLPPPTPVPPTPIPPTPVPPVPAGVAADFVVGITDNTARTLPQAGILMDGELLSWLNAANVKWRVVDKDAAEFANDRYAADLAAAKVTPPAAIRYLKGKVLSVVSADKVPTSDAVKAFVKGTLADELVKWDVETSSLYYKQDGEKRLLTRLSPDKAKLVPLQKAVRWSDVKTVIPRDKWRDVSRRDIFPASLWILDQGQVGSCVGNGATDALRKVRFLSGMTDLKLSPGCTYAQINGGSDNGAVIGDSMTALTQTGTVLYSTVGETPYYLRQLPQGWQAEASRFKIAEAYVTPTFDEMASAIQLGYILVYGMQVGNNFEHFTAEGVAGISPGQGNHCMHADGMKKLANGQFAFDNANSWGATWGPWGNGRCYLVEGHFAHANISDTYAIKAAIVDPQESIKPRASADPAPVPPALKAPATTTVTTPASATYASPVYSSETGVAPPGYRWACVRDGRGRNSCTLIPIGSTP